MIDQIPSSRSAFNGQASECGHDKDAVVLPVAVSGLSQRYSRIRCQLFSIDQRWRIALIRPMPPVRKLVT